jgi:hypothetical protein
MATARASLTVEDEKALMKARSFGIAPEGMKVYRSERSSVTDCSFGILKLLPENPLTLYEQFDSITLRRLIKQHPLATLEQLCNHMQQERGIVLSPQTMCKLLLRVGLTRKVRRQLQTRDV